MAYENADDGKANDPTASAAAPVPGDVRADGPDTWKGLKAWIRHELELVARGHTAEERETLNP